MAAPWRSVLNRTVLVGALGYFVDIYDLVLFGVVRRESLLALGVAEEDLVDVGILLLNWQMFGLLVGGVLWGVLGDRHGRIKVLFGSILLYSLANIANAFVVDVATYAALRFVAGVGLAGELGAAVTLVAEVMPKETRGYGAAILASLGILGAVVAALVGDFFPWQTAYVVGGLLGLVLLLARFTMRDSAMYHRAQATTRGRGNILRFFTNRDRFARYANSLLVGVPIWFVVGVLITFSPELGLSLGVQGRVNAGYAILWTYVGLSLGDLASGFLSGYLRSRKKILLAFLTLTSLLIYVYVFTTGLPLWAFYTLCFSLGLSTGYWAVFITNAAEQFGTDLRATAATTAPNFVRGAVVPITLAFSWLAQTTGRVISAMIIGQATILIALVALRNLKETYGVDLDYTETDAEPDASARPDPAFS